MEKKTIQCWGTIGSTGESITIVMECKTIEEFKESCEAAGYTLTEKPYII